MKRPEQALQKSIIDYVDRLPFPVEIYERCRWLMPPVKIGDFIHHTPNGGARSAAEGAIFKGLGVRAGYPDLSFDLALTSKTTFWPGWRCELKIGNEKPTPSQRLWHERLECAGFMVTIARSFEQYQTQLFDYLKLGDPFFVPRAL